MVQGKSGHVRVSFSSMFIRVLLHITVLYVTLLVTLLLTPTMSLSIFMKACVLGFLCCFFFVCFFVVVFFVLLFYFFFIKRKEKI